ncbi:colicin immunity domain-containing protein [Mycolicibacterium thermoresistibile]|jgi:hypothetical protein
MSSNRDAVDRMLIGYKPIIGRFVSGESSAAQFEEDFLSYFKSDANQVPGEDFDILDALFADVDDYVDDPALRAEVGGLDENELRERASNAYRRLYGEQ